MREDLIGVVSIVKRYLIVVEVGILITEDTIIKRDHTVMNLKEEATTLPPKTKTVKLVVAKVEETLLEVDIITIKVTMMIKIQIMILVKIPEIYLKIDQDNNNQRRKNCPNLKILTQRNPTKVKKGRRI